MKSHISKKLILMAIATAAAALSGCGLVGNGFETPGIAFQALNNPGDFIITGSGTAEVGNNLFLYASSAGTVSASGNNISVTFNDPATPIQEAGGGELYSDQASGTCNLGNMVSTPTDSTGETWVTQIAAQGCSDQETIALYLDTSQLIDAAGNSGQNVFVQDFIVDNAPIVEVFNSGTNSGLPNAFAYAGTAEELTPLVFHVQSGTQAAGGTAPDTALAVTFSKSLSGGALNVTLGPCDGMTLGSTSLMSATNGLTVLATMATIPASVTGSVTCTLNVSGVTDSVGNPDDPQDPNASMNFTLEN